MYICVYQINFFHIIYSDHSFPSTSSSQIPLLSHSPNLLLLFLSLENE